MLHFAHFAKEAEGISRHRYRIKIRYNKNDEIELVIRVLSFGPLIKITEPESASEIPHFMFERIPVYIILGIVKQKSMWMMSIPA